MMHRFPEGLSRRQGAPEAAAPRRAALGARPCNVFFPRYKRTADELCVTELGSVIWAVQMSTVEFHPWNSRRADTEKPDEWRIDLDPMPDCDFARVRRVAHVAHEVLDELGAVGWPKTSGGKGMHIYVRIEPRWGFADVRRAALAFAREVERRAPGRRHHHVVAQGPRSEEAVRRLQPERPRPHHRQRLFGPRQSRRARCRRRSAGTRSTTCCRTTSPWPPCRPGSPSSATCTPASTTRCSPSRPLLEWADRDERAGAADPGGAGRGGSGRGGSGRSPAARPAARILIH